VLVEKQETNSDRDRKEVEELRANVREVERECARQMNEVIQSIVDDNDVGAENLMMMEREMAGMRELLEMKSMWIHGPEARFQEKDQIIEALKRQMAAGE
jgi:hypothetical protein